MTHLYKIKNKQGQIVTFRPNYPQLKHLADRAEHRYNLIVKARQFGFTTLYCIDYLDEALWVKGMSCAILGHERTAVGMIFEIVKRAFVNLPEALKPRTKTDTKSMYQFTHRFDGDPLDSMIYVALKLRSGTVQKLHITESAYIKDRQELVAGSKQAVPISGSISEETTGNGFGEFYDFYIDRYNKPITELEYQSYFYPWFANPEYRLPGYIVPELLTADEIEMKEKHKLNDQQLLWRRWKMSELKQDKIGAGLTGDQLFKQEYPSSVLEAFQSGSGNIFDAEKVMGITPHPGITDAEAQEFFLENYGSEEGDEKFLTFMSLKMKGISFYELPEPGKQYLEGIDPADGTGSDNTCIDIWSDPDLHQCAQYYGKIRPDEAAELGTELAIFYNRAFAGVENNLLTVILFMSKIYDNFYYETKIDEKTQKRTKKLGWSTNMKTRDVVIDEFLILFEEDNILIRSAITLGEMLTFVRNEKGKREHATGKHDDSLFAAFIALKMRHYNRPRARSFATSPF